MRLDFFLALEIAGVTFGLLYVIGAVLEKWWCWPFGILGVLFYGISTYFSNMYGESILQVFYFFLSIYGWINWTNKTSEIKVSKVSFKELMFTIVLSLISFVLFYRLLLFMKGDLPFWDALTNGFAIGATYLVARKKIENWIFWVFIDIALTIILWHKSMYFYSVLYFVYTVVAITGFFEWRKKFLK